MQPQRKQLLKELPFALVSHCREDKGPGRKVHEKDVPDQPQRVLQDRHRREEGSAMVCRNLQCPNHRTNHPLTRRPLMALILYVSCDSCI